MEMINADVQTFLNRYYRPVSDALVPFRETGEKDRIPIILKETESVLTMLLKLKKPARVLEIGTAIGYSAAFFALSCPEAEIYTIEKDELAYSAARLNVKRAGVSDRVHLLFGDGQEQIEKLRDRGIADVDFVFIDAAKSHYKRFLESALEICGDGAVIVSDNILMHGLTVFESAAPDGKHRRKHNTNRRKMREYLDFITRDPRMTTSLMTVGDGMAVTLYEKK
ncbi:O-methyltransferase [Hornefia butyriciproducens]|uniref:O-methyltransferase n=1 Tax=Hornefia butyriciproducens TaxID=2652293 RepID=UPI0029F7502C|nr:O-methyltransferase [Hornefia butyriciproducens]MDD7020790.1 O-methyltransferase [Hornefia butyriciproducens]MDY5463394.1 O-methyltransferase [Hornefia butyriciproducens]